MNYRMERNEKMAMQAVEVSIQDGKQIIALPEGYQLPGNVIFLERKGQEIVLHSESEVWKHVENALDSFSPDFADLVEEGHRQVSSAVPFDSDEE